MQETVNSNHGLTLRQDPIRCYHSGARVDLEAMAMSEFSAFPKAPAITGTLLSDCLVSYVGYSLGGGILPLCREVVGVFYCPSQQGSLSLTLVR